MTIKPRIVGLLFVAFVGMALLVEISLVMLGLVFERANYANVNSLPSLNIMLNRLLDAQHLVSTGEAKLAALDTVECGAGSGQGARG